MFYIFSSFLDELNGCMEMQKSERIARTEISSTACTTAYAWAFLNLCRHSDSSESISISPPPLFSFGGNLSLLLLSGSNQHHTTIIISWIGLAISASITKLLEVRKVKSPFRVHLHRVFASHNLGNQGMKSNLTGRPR